MMKAVAKDLVTFGYDTYRLYPGRWWIQVARVYHKQLAQTGQANSAITLCGGNTNFMDHREERGTWWADQVTCPMCLAILAKQQGT